MGVVYQGFDPTIERTVAIKTMLTEGLSPQEFQEYKARFKREAMAAGILAHPNIITVYDFGEDSGVLYLAMEFLEGKSLEKIVQEQTVLPIETILPIYDQVCSALDMAHRNKIVHRDIKPANIMILQNGLVKVTDFGIAKMMAMGMTQAGQILGTPNYMSPEQVKGRQIDGRSDIFSLGVILYELCTGEKPFGGQNITTVIYKIINENPIPPRELDASIHAGLSYVIAKALAKNVDERYQTCGELAEDLRNYKNLGGPATGQGTVMMQAPAAPMEAPEPPAPTRYQMPQPPAPPRQSIPTIIEAPPTRVTEVPIAGEEPPTTVDETPIASSLNIHMIPPPAPRQQSIPQIAWVIGALLVVAIMGVISYFFFLRPESQTNNAEISRPVEKVTQPQILPPVNPTAPTPGTQASTTPATGSGTSTTPTPGPGTSTTPTPAPEKPPAPTPVTQTPVAPAPATPSPRTKEPASRLAPAKVGQLMVSANVTGAKISVDGQSDPRWVTPYTIPDLPAGGHNVVISMDGYESYRSSVTIEGGQTSNVAGTLSSPRAELDVVTSPAGVEVFIDGKSYGPSPVKATLAPGNHTYSVKLPGAAPFESNIALRSGDIITKRLSAAAAVTTGIVEVRTIPPGATVLADGSPVSGQTPTSFRLSVGTHMLVISLSGYPPVQRQVTVSENATTPVNVTLTGQ